MSDKIVSLSGRKSKKAEDKKNDKKEQRIDEPKEELCCSFCKRPSSRVLKLVRGPEVNICSECTMIAVQYLILEDKMPSGEAQKILDAFWRKL